MTLVKTPWLSVTPSRCPSTATCASAAGCPSTRAFTSRSTREPPLQAASRKATSAMTPDRIVGLSMSCPLMVKRAIGLQGRGLDVHFPGIDDLVLVGFRTLDGPARSFLDLAELELDLLARVLLDLHGLRVGLVTDAARFHSIGPGLEPILHRLARPVRIGRHGMRRLLESHRRVDHVDHRALERVLPSRLSIAVDELDCPVDLGRARREQCRQRHCADHEADFRVHTFPVSPEKRYAAAVSSMALGPEITSTIRTSPACRRLVPSGREHTSDGMLAHRTPRVQQICHDSRRRFAAELAENRSLPRAFGDKWAILGRELGKTTRRSRSPCRSEAGLAAETSDYDEVAFSFATSGVRAASAGARGAPRQRSRAGGVARQSPVGRIGL